MAARFDLNIEAAQRLITRNGMSVTWRSLADAAPADPDQPWNPGETVPDEHTVDMVFLPVDRSDPFFSLIRNTEVPKGAIYGLMAPQDFTPKIKDTVVRNGVTYAVSSIDVLQPNDQIILYTVYFDL